MARTRIPFHSFGCKLNFPQIASVTLEFDNKKIGFTDIAVVYFINACSATKNEDKMDNIIPISFRNKRSKMARMLSARKRRAFYES